MTKSKRGSRRRRYTKPKNRRQKREAEQAANERRAEALSSVHEANQWIIHALTPIGDVQCLCYGGEGGPVALGAQPSSVPTLHRPDIDSTRTNLDDSATLLTSSYTIGKQRNKIRVDCSERPLCTLLTATLTGILDEVSGDEWTSVAERAIRAANGASASRACDYQHASFPNDVGAKERLTKKASAQFGWRRWM